MRRNDFLKIAFILISFFMSSCFENAGGEKSNSSSSQDDSKKSLINSENWSGAKAGLNKITGVLITWELPSVETTSFKVYRYSGKNLNLLATLSNTTKGYIDGSVTWGVIYTYIVRAVDKNGIEDDNTNKVSVLSWSGISSVESLNRSSIQVNFSNAVAVVDEIRIYIQPASGGDKELIKTVTGSEVSTEISGLKTGFKYKVSAQAYVSTLKKEDGNEATFEVSTNTLSYHDENASVAKWLNVVNIRAFGASSAAPVHPVYPERTPTGELVELSFKSFNGMDSGTVYVVTRATTDSDLDTSSEAPCETTTKSACRVKCSSSSYTMTGSGILTCRDEKAGPSPARYRYTMSIQHTEDGYTWVEPIPKDNLDNFSVIVPMPPANMILVQRDAVNYEMCGQMNSAVDPKNHNRCPYTGIGGTPYNSGPGKPALTFSTGFYDFGYNLFEDRYPMGCNWTKGSAGGKCGAGKTTGDCIATSEVANVLPSTSVGVDGDVFFMMWPGENLCLYKYGTSWLRAYQVFTTVPDSKSAYAKMYRSNPSDTDNGGFIPVARETASQYSSFLSCQAQEDSNYGSKRIPRMREYRAMQAFPTVAGELYGMTYSAASTIASGGSFNSSSGFRCPVNIGTNYTWPTNVSQMLTGTNELFGVYSNSIYQGTTFKINSLANVDCQSRYGAHQVFVNWWWTSDTFAWNSTTKTVTGTSSVLDDGNRDLLTDINGGQTGYQMNYTTATLSGTSYYLYSLSSSTNVYFMSIPMGLPVLVSSAVSYLSRLLFTENYGPTIYYPYTVTASFTDRAALAHARWSTYLPPQSVSGAFGSSNTRCVMSAD
ncbi:MAG: fibronectin type III domain-containing protein [Bdellovibrionaceae bacterium]|nr:fibronectin type III domain-containing protein [Pseudobdellovibrionaceae bacterium]